MATFGRVRIPVPRSGATLALVLVTACGSDGDAAVGRKPSVAVSVPPLAGFVERLAPRLVEITTAIPPGANPATHEPTVAQLRGAQGADVFFALGHPAFGWELTWLSPLLRGGSARRVDTAGGCDWLADDPHVWLSTDCAAVMATRIGHELILLRPDHQDDIRRRLEALLAEIEAVGREVDERLRKYSGRKFLVLHPAWGYLVREYAIVQLSILEHGAGDAGAGGLARTIREARRARISTVFVQPQFSAEPAELVAIELGASVVSLDPLGEDWSTVMKTAARALEEALGR